MREMRRRVFKVVLIPLIEKLRKVAEEADRWKRVCAEEEKLREEMRVTNHIKDHMNMNIPLVLGEERYNEHEELQRDISDFYKQRMGVGK